MIKLTLKDENGKDKTYTQSRKSTRKIRQALKLMMKDENRAEGEELTISDQLEQIDEMLGFIVDVFDNQFTFDELQDGLDAGTETDTCLYVIDEVLAGEGDKKKTNQQKS